MITSQIVDTDEKGVKLCAREPVAVTSVIIAADTIVDMDDVRTLPRASWYSLQMRVVSDLSI